MLLTPLDPTYASRRNTAYLRRADRDETAVRRRLSDHHVARFVAMREQAGEAEVRYMGLPLRELIDFARALASRPAHGSGAEAGEHVLLDLVLRPL